MHAQVHSVAENGHNCKILTVTAVTVRGVTVTDCSDNGMTIVTVALLV